MGTRGSKRGAECGRESLWVGAVSELMEVICRCSEAYSLLYIKHRSAEKKLLYINVIKNIFVLIHFAQT